MNTRINIYNASNTDRELVFSGSDREAAGEAIVEHFDAYEAEVRGRESFPAAEEATLTEWVEEALTAIRDAAASLADKIGSGFYPEHTTADPDVQTLKLEVEYYETY